MINKWETLSKSAAAQKADRWTNLPNESFDVMSAAWDRREVSECPPAYVQLRNKLVSAYDDAKATVMDDETLAKSSNKTYQLEYRYALQVFRIFDEEGMSVRTASDDSVWRFISMNVIPDIVYDRWHDSKNPKYINPDRFYFATRRIWPKVLWWFVYLCWQGTEEETGKLISTNTANEISQLVERSGSGGYRLDLFREIIRYYDTNISQAQRTKEHNLLSRVLQLNIARSQIIEPDLVPGGVPEYTKQLFAYFGY